MRKNNESAGIPVSLETSLDIINTGCFTYVLNIRRDLFFLPVIIRGDHLFIPVEKGHDQILMSFTVVGNGNAISFVLAENIRHFFLIIRCFWIY